MKKLCLALVLLPALLLAACSREGEPGRADAPPAAVSDIVPAIKEEGCVLGFVQPFTYYYGSLYVRGNEEQNERGLALLDTLDLSGAERVEEKEDAYVRKYQMYVKWEGDGCQIELAAVDANGDPSRDERRLRFRFDSGEAFYLQGGIKPVAPLDDLAHEVLFSNADWAAVQYPVGAEDRSCSVDRMLTALEFLENRMDLPSEMTPAEFDPAEGGYDFDCRITVESTDCLMGSIYNNMTEEIEATLNAPLSVTDTVYDIDTKTGVFRKKTPSGEEYYRFPGGLPPHGFRPMLPEAFDTPQ